GLLLQSAKPLSHMPTAHAPPLQAAVPCAIWQTSLQEPQCCGFWVVSISHPFSIMPSQSSKPASHIEKVHTESVHVVEAWAKRSPHVWPHDPQLAVSLVVSISQ